VIADVFFFMFSMVITCIILYILAQIWFSNTRTHDVRSFVAFGLAASLWTLFSAMTAISADELFIFSYTLHLVTGCIFPYVFFWFALVFADSRLSRSRVLHTILVVSASLECVAFATNPIHKLMFKAYTYPDLPTGPLFAVHALIAYALALGAILMVFRSVLRNKKRTPLLVIASISTLVPYIINVLLALNLLGTRRDLTPVGFFLTFAMFALLMRRSGLFSLKSLALGSIFGSLSDVIIIIDAQGLIIDSNAAFDHTFHDFAPAADTAQLSEFSAWIAEKVGDKASDLFASLTDPDASYDGAEFDLPAENDEEPRTFTLTRDLIMQRGSVAGVVATLTDVSAYRAMISEINIKNEHLVELNALAEEASKAKSVFLANMSHEIRTPINAITGMATIARGTSDISRIHDCLNKVDTASRQLLGIINDILDISKIEADKMELASEPFELHATAHNIKSIIGVRAAEKDQTLTLTIADDLPHVVLGDDMRLSQVLLNLLSNAVKFTPNRGSISLDLRLIESDGVRHLIEAEVRDTGIGISPEQQSRLFNTFEQADRGTSKRYGGSGLGLVISKRIAELMGGGITLESELGKGSTFTARFLLRAGTADMILRQGDRRSYDFSDVTALLAEDIEINREIVIALLEDYGIQIDCAETGREAADMFFAAPERYDIIFMDIQMPVMDGYEATLEIRASDLPAARKIPIVAMTANAFSEDIAHCRAVGMDDHVAKPIDLDTLLEKMAYFIPQTK